MDFVDIFILATSCFAIISVPLFEYIIDWEEEKREKAEQKKTNA